MSVAIPIHGRSGVVGHALVDDADAALVSRYRWNMRGGGYAVAGAASTGRTSSVYMHRLILGLTDPKDCTDHINGDKLDNRRVNLRVGTQALNNQNRAALPGASSRFRGVCWKQGDQKWIASVTVDGQVHNVGRFRSELDAAYAADELRRQVMPFAERDPALVALEAEEAA